MNYPNIEAERARAGMTRGGMAAAINVSTDTVKNWQSGRTEIPVSKIVALADLFNVSTDYLLNRAAAKLCLSKALFLLSDTAKTALDETYGDAATYLISRIEAEVKKQKPSPYIFPCFLVNIA